MHNTISAVQAPPGMAEWITAASVVPLKKRDGCVSPIAIDETVHGLVSKPWMSQLRHHVSAHLIPLQVVIAVQSGAEDIVHAFPRLSDRISDDKDYALLQLYFKNALNLVSRPSFLRVRRRCFPELHAY